MKLCPGAVDHGQLNCYGSWHGCNGILELRTHSIPTSAPNVTDKSSCTDMIRTRDPRFECPSVLPNELIGKFPLATASRSTDTYSPPPPPSSEDTPAPNVTDKSTSTEEIRTRDPRFECPSAATTELIGTFPLATASRSTLYQHCYILSSPPPPSNEATSLQMWQINHPPLKGFEPGTLDLIVHVLYQLS